MLLKRAEAELKLYVSKDTEDRKRSVRERLLKQIQEQEKRSKVLKEDQKKVKEGLGLSSKQVKLWGDLAKLFEVKKRCLENSRRADDDDVIHRERGTETLVL